MRALLVMTRQITKAAVVAVHPQQHQILMGERD
jgi:hypothetical protein